MRGYELTDFLASIAKPAGFAKFRANPEECLAEASLSEEKKQAVRDGDAYRIRRYSAQEMAHDSSHARMLLKVFQENDPEFKARGVYGNEIKAAFPVDLDTDTDVDTDHNIVQTTDLGDDIAEFTPQYNNAHHYDHLFTSIAAPSRDHELVFVGTGINGANHLSAEAEAHIAGADTVLYCVADTVIERRLHLLNENHHDLYVLYGDDKQRRNTYEEMVELILKALDQNTKVCAVFYGHPGIFVWPSYRSIQIARRQGYHAHMLPAISSLDCLFADVGFDPSRHSCQILEATDMLVRSRRPDVTASVVLFQVGCVGDLGYNSRGYDRRNVPILAEYLAEYYGWEYEVILYEASQYPVCPPRIVRVPLSNLADARPSGVTTLYIPPKALPAADELMMGRLGLSLSSDHGSNGREA